MLDHPAHAVIRARRRVSIGGGMASSLDVIPKQAAIEISGVCKV
jgi:hypothetical protein